MKLWKKLSIVGALALSLGVSANASSLSALSFVSEKDATGDVKKVYSEIKQAWGMVPIIMKQFSLSPELLRNQWSFYKITAKNKNFDEKMMTIMRMLIADKNSCDYCVSFNKGMLLNMFKMPVAELKEAIENPNSVKLDTKQKAMFLFLLKSTNSPHDTTKSDIDNLTKLGWSDKDIFEGVKITTNMVGVTLMIEALKIQKDF